MRHRKHLLGAALVLCIVLFASMCYSESDNRSFFWGVALDGLPITSPRITSLTKTYGRAPAMVVFFLQWPSHPALALFPQSTLLAISQSGAVPCLTWEPMSIRDGKEQAVPAEEILSGVHDSYIDAMARMCRDFGQTVVLRFAHEMNLARYHWGGSLEEYGPQSPERYKKMFRYVVSRFRAAGATQVLFAFCPNSESLPDPERDKANWNQLQNYYPGNDVVDILGMDGYNWGTTQTKQHNGWESSFRSFRSIFSQAHEQLRLLSVTKPIVVFETASAAKGGDKNAWIRNACATAQDWQLAGLVWFEAQKEVDWRLANKLKGNPDLFLGELLGTSFQRKDLFHVN